MSKDLSAVLLASGGLDSTTMAFWLLDKDIHFLPLFIDYGQHFAETEFETLKSVLPKSVVDLIVRLNIGEIYQNSQSRMIIEPDLWKNKVVANDLYMPYRNLLLLSVAAAYAQSNGFNDVYSAFINSNHAKEIDCSASFFSTLGGLMKEYGGISIKMPFRHLSKLKVAKLGKQLGVSIGLTYSCQASSEIPCGACPNCVDRLNALNAL